MQDTDWDDLRYFLAVARIGSLSGAAKSLNVNHSTVLRRLGSLQDRLGVRLFERVPTGYTMTHVGEALAERLSGVGERIEAAQRQLGGLDLRLSGVVRVTTTDTLMHGLLMPLLAEFRQTRRRSTRPSLTSNATQAKCPLHSSTGTHLTGSHLGCSSSG